jgi:hypothetical protein
MKEKQTKSDSFHKYSNYEPHLKPIDKPKGDKFKKINKWLSSHKFLVLSFISILAITLGVSVYYLFGTIDYSTPTVASVKKKEIKKTYSPLTGAEVSEADSKLPLTAVMIENSPEARPQSGLKDAGVVFEAVAEGGITRFLAIYQEAKPGVIGPVRSVRPHYASWVAAFDAGLAHVGGSDIPLAKLRSGQIKDLDQFFNAAAYYRSNERYAPHNVYTSMEKLQGLNNAKKYSTSTFTSWTRVKKEQVSPTPTAKSIDIPVSTGLFAVHYDWDPATNSYQRSQGGGAHIDREAGRITPKVVITMQVPHDVIKESNRYSYPDVIGSGKAWLFQNGTVTEIGWSKASDKDQIIFTDPTGKPVEFNRGQTWITAIKPDKTPSWQ